MLQRYRLSFSTFFNIQANVLKSILVKTLFSQEVLQPFYKFLALDLSQGFSRKMSGVSWTNPNLDFETINF